MNNDMSNAFYQIGKAFPAFYATRELRHILFGSYASTTAANTCIILAWLLATGALAAAMYWMKWNKVGKSMNQIVRNKIMLGEPVEESQAVSPIAKSIQGSIEAPSIKQTAYY
jgi:hypothetical protein